MKRGLVIVGMLLTSLGLGFEVGPSVAILDANWTCSVVCHVTCSDTSRDRQVFSRISPDVVIAFQAMLADCDDLGRTFCGGRGISSLRYDGDNSASLSRNCVR